MSLGWSLTRKNTLATTMKYCDFENMKARRPEINNTERFESQHSIKMRQELQQKIRK